jgi:PKHD-type hydroxylase
MEYVFTPYARQIEPWAWWDGAFTDEQLDWMQARAKDSSAPAKVGGGIVDDSIRRSELSWIPCNDETKWVFEKLSHVASSLNVSHFGFNLTGLGEALQLTTYNEGNRGMYGWHQDFNGEVSRKLSIVVQLSHPSDYEGGNLEIMAGNSAETIPKKRGYIAVFPAWALHQVTPVTKGNRQSLVAWVSGEPFK